MWPIANSQRKKKAAANDILGLLAYHPSCGLVGLDQVSPILFPQPKKKADLFIYIYIYSTNNMIFTFSLDFIILPTYLKILK